MEALNNMAEISPLEIVRIADEKGKQFANIKTHQIRNFFSEINALKLSSDKQESEGALRTRIVLLKPKLAYATGRKPNELRPFYELMTTAIDGVMRSDENHFKIALNNFIMLVESIVAYHRFYGGRDN